MNVDLDRTQEWLNRTQAIRRAPPVRGGSAVDWRARRQTAGGIGVVIAALLLLLLMPYSGREPSNGVRPRTDGSRGAAGLVERAARPPAALPDSGPPPAAEMPRSPKPVLASQILERRGMGSPPGNRIAPHAPIWLVTEPREWPPLSSPPAEAPGRSGYSAAAGLVTILK